MLILEEEQKEVQSWIQKKMPEIIEDLKRICRIKSVAKIQDTKCPPFGQGCIDVLKEMLQLGQENGFATWNYDNYIGRISYSENCKSSENPENMEEGKGIGIWVHLDVVEEGEGWQYQPFDPIVKDGYFIARGCQDNKSSAIIGLYVLKYIKEYGIILRHPLSLYCGVSEEKGMQDLDYFLKHYSCPELSLVPDSGFPVCCGERGTFCGELVSSFDAENVLEISCDCGLYTIPDKASVNLRYSEKVWEICKDLIFPFQAEREEDKIFITASGVLGNASVANSGKNALTELSQFLSKQNLLSEPENKVFQFLCEINKDYSGNALNICCRDELSGMIHLTATQIKLEKGKFVIGFMSRYPVTQNDFPFEERARKAAKKWGFELRTTRLEKANYFQPNREVVKVLTQVSNKVLLREDKPFVMSGNTYAKKLPNAFAFGTGMALEKPPQGLFRPGCGDYHQPDESIALQRIQKALEIYILGIQRIDRLDSF